MNNHIVLNNPPFTPADDQVIYMEWQHNESINAFIRKHYEWLKNLFLTHGLHFCYLPMLGKDVIKYHAPHLSDAECDEILASLPSLQDYVVTDEYIRAPILAFSARIVNCDVLDIPLYYIEIDNKWYKPTKSIFKKLAEEIISQKKETKLYASFVDNKEEGVCEPTGVSYGHYSEIHYSLCEEADKDAINEQNGHKKNYDSTNAQFSLDVRYSLSPRIEADEIFDDRAKELVKEIKERINALRDYGINTLFIHQIIDENVKLSRMVITKDYKIILPDYNNIEIEMAALPKSVFLLFLRHPEGIRFKELPDYYYELMDIYLNFNPMGSKQKQETSIRNITDPLSNSINEKCARIREAFISKFDESLAKNYYITGKKGEPKKITLPLSMIVWDK